MLYLHVTHLRVRGEGLHNLPNSGDNPYSVTADHQHHYVDTDAGQQNLPLANTLLFPQCACIVRHIGVAGGQILQVVHVLLNLSEEN